jgi:hypothetical protein
VQPRLGASVTILDATQDDPVVGHVGDGTRLEELRVETAPMAADAGLAEGRLLGTESGTNACSTR